MPRASRQLAVGVTGAVCCPQTDIHSREPETWRQSAAPSLFCCILAGLLCPSVGCLLNVAEKGSFIFAEG